MATIIFDLDDTLYDTQQFKRDIENILTDQGVSSKDVWDSYKIVRNNGNYTFDLHIQELSKKYKTLEREKILASLLNLLSKSYLFSTTKKILKELKKNHRLLLLTSGAEKTQRRKIRISKIKNYFDAIHILSTEEFPRKIDFLKTIQWNDNVYFVNDKENENEEVRTLFPNFIIVATKNGESINIPASPFK